jgi:hypothetical protein
VTRPLLLELDDATWNGWHERVRPWLATTAMLQAAFRDLLERTVDDITESHWHHYLGEILVTAREHETQLADIHAAFGVEPAGHERVRDAAGAIMSTTRSVLGHVEGLAAGARGGTWRKLRELLLTNLDAIGAYGVVEQLGLALARPAVTDLTVPILTAKGEHQLQLQECFLEFASNAILLDKDV